MFHIPKRGEVKKKLKCLIDSYKNSIAKKVPPLAEGQIAAKKYFEWEKEKDTTDWREAPCALSVSLSQIAENKGGIWLFRPKPCEEGEGVKNLCMRLKSCFLNTDDRGKNRNTVKGNNSCYYGKHWSENYLKKNIISG